MDDPEQWRWIWLVAAVGFTVGEMLSPGSFFLLPFAVGALLAAILAFAGAESLVLGWAVFVGVSTAAFFALRPLARRLDQEAPAKGIGAKRLIGEVGSVVEAIDGHGDTGVVRVHREEWRAETVDDTPLDDGTRVRIVEVRGTRVVVTPVERAEPPAIDH